MSKAYRLKNGVVLETEAEVKAYIRGLELARAAQAEEVLNELIEDAQNVKNAGPTEEVLPEPEKPAETPATEAADPQPDPAT